MKSKRRRTAAEDAGLYRYIGEGTAERPWLKVTRIDYLVTRRMVMVELLGNRRAAKKFLLVGLTLVCVVATSLMGLPVWGVAAVTGLVVVANAAFLLGENLVAAFLPELAPPGKRGKISAYGWGFGYVGGLASLGLALWILSDAEGSVRKVFPAVAGFMVLAALPTILFLKERAKPGRESVTEPDWRAVWSTIRDRPELRRLLLGLGASLTGLSSVVGFASIYATKEIGFTLEDTVKLFVVLQGAAVVGSLEREGRGVRARGGANCPGGGEVSLSAFSPGGQGAGVDGRPETGGVGAKVADGGAGNDRCGCAGFAVSSKSQVLVLG